MRRRLDEYRHGDHNSISDRTGFKVKASELRPEWTGNYVESRHWEPRHPQDFVRGIRDNPAVDNPRPGPADTFGVSETTLDADELPGQTVLSVTSTANMTVGDSIKIALDNDEFHLSTISSFSAGDTVTIGTAIPSKAASGNTVYIYSNEPQAGAL
jgi:hypothetical protein